MTLTDDEVDTELRRLRAANMWESDHIVARHFYALGMAAIPREPTQAMHDAARRAFSEWAAGSSDTGPVLLWRAMWDAAQGYGHDYSRLSRLACVFRPLDEIERMQAIVDAAVAWRNGTGTRHALILLVQAYTPEEP